MVADFDSASIVCAVYLGEVLVLYAVIWQPMLYG